MFDFKFGVYNSCTVKSRPLAALVDKPQAQIMFQKPGKTLIPIDKPQVYFVDVVKCVNKVCSQKHLALPTAWNARHPSEWICAPE